MLDAFLRLLGWLAAVGVFTLVAMAGLAVVCSVAYSVWRAWRPQVYAPQPDAPPADASAKTRTVTDMKPSYFWMEGYEQFERVHESNAIPRIHRGSMTRDWPDDPN